MRNQASIVITLAALALGIFFQIDWLFFLGIALAGVLVLTAARKPASVHHTHSHAEKTEESEEEEEKEQLVIIKQPKHVHPSELGGEKIAEEILERYLTLPWEHVEHKWWKGHSKSYGHKPGHH